MDGKKVYNGDISLQVRFRGKRVSGLVENLMDGDGNVFQYGFGKGRRDHPRGGDHHDTNG